MRKAMTWLQMNKSVSDIFREIRHKVQKQRLRILALRVPKWKEGFLPLRPKTPCPWTCTACLAFRGKREWGCPTHLLSMPGNPTWTQGQNLGIPPGPSQSRNMSGSLRQEIAAAQGPLPPAPLSFGLPDINLNLVYVRGLALYVVVGGMCLSVAVAILAGCLALLPLAICILTMALCILPWPSACSWSGPS